MLNLSIKQAVTKDEIQAVFALRKEVFVDEEKLFSESDKDEHDEKSLYIIAKIDNAIVGTIRIFPLDQADVWEMGRIVVRKGYRDHHLGALLAQEGVKLAQSKGCKRLLGIVQRHAVELFLGVGWKKLGHEIDYLGVPHQVMEADLRQ